MHRTFACFLLGALAVMGQPPANQQDRWNKVFASSDADFNRRPNAFLMKSVEGLKPGEALEVGMGQGRNAIALARLGWKVTGIDISDEGIRQANAEAKKQGVTINAILADADKFDYGHDRYDLIFATFMQQIFSDNAEKMLPALKPGGVIITEGFQDDFSKEIGRQLGYRVNELLRAFNTFRITYYEDTVGPADWNGGNPAPIVRMIARKERK
jgi:ubiquinone/menaquinone biosynthesis C-methylase UbiE